VIRPPTQGIRTYVLRAFLIVDGEVKLREEFVLSRLTSVELLSRSEVPQVLVIRENLDFVGRTTEVRPPFPECFDNSY